MVKPKGLLGMLVLLVILSLCSGNAVYAKGNKQKGRVKSHPLTPQIMREIIYRANYYGLDPLLVMEVMRQESSFNPNACSSANARGLMQFIPSTAARFGISDPHNISQSIDAGCRYLSFLIRKFDGRLDLVLAGYNAGEGAVQRYNNTIPPYEETRNYVRSIVNNYKRALLVKEAFLKGNNISLNKATQNKPIVSYGYKTFDVVNKKALTKRQIQQKLAELDALDSVSKDKKE